MPVGMHGLLRDSDAFTGHDATEETFTRRTNLDIVTGHGVPADTVALLATPAWITLSTPCPGASGKARLSFRHNRYNYCVHFSMPVP